jgi:hypothetical protein
MNSNDEQRSNISSIYTLFNELKIDKSNETKEEHIQNIHCICVEGSLIMSTLGKFREIKDKQL